MILDSGKETTKTRPEKVNKGVRVHPELWRVFGSRCKLEGVSMEEKLHAMLCHECERADLLDALAVPAP